MTPQCPQRVRTLFVSDLHLGYKGADIAALNKLLESCQFEQLYLVGDIFDGWKLEKRWHWTAEYSEFVDRLMDLRQRRVRIVLMTGNHDEKLREVVPRMLRPLILRRFGIRIEERMVHHARDGRRFLVMHGDQFDGVLLRGTSRLADRLWAWLSERALVPPRRAKTGAEGRRWSLGKALAQNASALHARYHSRALRRVVREGLDGIVFGHSHVPVLERRAGRLLANCGSWTAAKRPGGQHTAMIETLAGELQMLQWPVRRSQGVAGSLAPDEVVTRHPDSLRIIRAIHALWRGSPGRTGVPARPRHLPKGRPIGSLPDLAPPLRT